MALTLDGTAGITFPVTAGSASAVQASSGRVLQVVNATYSTTFTSTSSSSFVDSGFSASITPSSSTSKILCEVHMTGNSKDATAAHTAFQLVRGSTAIIQFEGRGGYSATSVTSSYGSCSTTYLDSPATTSSTTYKVQIANVGGAGVVYFNTSSSVSSMTLMEIAA
jgi:hypothetical protein